MTQEDKQLLLVDLCARLPYGLKVHYTKHPNSSVDVDVDDTMQGYYCNLVVGHNGDYCIERCKPYLRPMSSMTEEEIKELGEVTLKGKFQGGIFGMLCPTYAPFDWLNAHHFDYRGLIEKGIALKAPEGMYQHETKLEFNESDSRIKVECKIRSKTNPNEILRIVSDDCHGNKFECSNGCVLSLKQIKKYYDLYIEENKGTIVIN